MNLYNLFESFNKKIVVILPGRFQPWHKGHAAVYNHLCQTYGKDNVFICTSDKTDNAKSPFSFEEKKKMMILTGVDSSKVIFSTQPYKATEVVSKFDPMSTVVLFAVSEKDMAEDPRFSFQPKKDGSPSFFQPFKNIKSCVPVGEDHAYMVTVPTFDFQVLGASANSASQIRDQFAKADEATQKKIVADLFGKFDVTVFRLMRNKLHVRENVAVEEGDDTDAEVEQNIASHTGRTQDEARAIIQASRKAALAAHKGNEQSPGFDAAWKSTASRKAMMPKGKEHLTMSEGTGISPETLASYKQKAGADASAADARGDFEHGNKRFKGIVQATNKEFDNDAKITAQNAMPAEDDTQNPDPKIRSLAVAVEKMKEQLASLTGQPTTESKMNISDLDEARNDTIEAHGIRGMDRKPWRRSFKNVEQMEAWCEKYDAEVHGTRDTDLASQGKLAPAIQGVDEGLLDVFKKKAEPQELEPLTPEIRAFINKHMPHNNSDIKFSDTKYVLPTNVTAYSGKGRINFYKRGGQLMAGVGFYRSGSDAMHPKVSPIGQFDEPISNDADMIKLKAMIAEGIDKHSFLGRINRHHELKGKVDSTWDDAVQAEKNGDKKAANRSFEKHVKYTNLERPGTWTNVKEAGVAEAAFGKQFKDAQDGKSKQSDGRVNKVSDAQRRKNQLAANKKALKGYKPRPPVTEADETSWTANGAKFGSDDGLDWGKGYRERKIAAIWAQITDYEKRAKVTKNDIKRDHYMKMAADLRRDLPASDEQVGEGISDALDNDPLAPKFGHNPEEDKKDTESFRQAFAQPKPKYFKTAKGDLVRVGNIDYLFSTESARWFSRRNDHKAGRDIAPKWIRTENVPHEVKAMVTDDELDEGFSLGKVLSLPQLLDQVNNVLTAKHSNIGWKMSRQEENVFLFSAENDYNSRSMLVIAKTRDGWVEASNGWVSPEGESEIFNRVDWPLTLASASEIADEAIETYHDIDFEDYYDEEFDGSDDELDEGYWDEAMKKFEKEQARRKANPDEKFEKNPASHDKDGVYKGDKDLDGKPVPKKVAESGKKGTSAHAKEAAKKKAEYEKEQDKKQAERDKTEVYQSGAAKVTKGIQEQMLKHARIGDLPTVQRLIKRLLPYADESTQISESIDVAIRTARRNAKYN